MTLSETFVLTLTLIFTANFLSAQTPEEVRKENANELLTAVIDSMPPDKRGKFLKSREHTKALLFAGRCDEAYKIIVQSKTDLSILLPEYCWTMGTEGRYESLKEKVKPFQNLGSINRFVERTNQNFDYVTTFPGLYGKSLWLADQGEMLESLKCLRLMRQQFIDGSELDRNDAEALADLEFKHAFGNTIRRTLERGADEKAIELVKSAEQIPGSFSPDELVGKIKRLLPAERAQSLLTKLGQTVPSQTEVQEQRRGKPEDQFFDAKRQIDLAEQALDANDFDRAKQILRKIPNKEALPWDEDVLRTLTKAQSFNQAEQRLRFLDDSIENFVVKEGAMSDAAIWRRIIHLHQIAAKVIRKDQRIEELKLAVEHILTDVPKRMQRRFWREASLDWIISSIAINHDSQTAFELFLASPKLNQKQTLNCGPVVHSLLRRGKIELALDFAAKCADPSMIQAEDKELTINLGDPLRNLDFSKTKALELYDRLQRLFPNDRGLNSKLFLDALINKDKSKTFEYAENLLRSAGSISDRGKLVDANWHHEIMVLGKKVQSELPPNCTHRQAVVPTLAKKFTEDLLYDDRITEAVQFAKEHIRSQRTRTYVLLDRLKEFGPRR